MLTTPSLPVELWDNIAEFCLKLDDAPGFWDFFVPNPVGEKEVQKSRMHLDILDVLPVDRDRHLQRFWATNTFIIDIEGVSLTNELTKEEFLKIFESGARLVENVYIDQAVSMSGMYHLRILQQLARCNLRTLTYSTRRKKLPEDRSLGPLIYSASPRRPGLRMPMFNCESSLAPVTEEYKEEFLNVLKERAGIETSRMKPENGGGGIMVVSPSRLLVTQALQQIKIFLGTCEENSTIARLVQKSNPFC